MSPPTSPGRGLMKKSSSSEIINGVMGAVHAIQRRASHLKIRRISEVTDGDSGPTSPDRKRHGMAKSASFPPLSVCREDDETPRPGDDWPWKNLDVAPLPSPSASAATLLQDGKDVSDMEVDVNLFEKSEGSMWTPSTRGETETIKALTTQASQRHAKQWLVWYRERIATVPSSERALWLATSASKTSNYLLILAQKEVEKVKESAPEKAESDRSEGAGQEQDQNQGQGEVVREVEISALLCTALCLQRAHVTLPASPELKRADIVAQSALKALACPASELIRIRPEIEAQTLAQVEQLVQLEASSQLKFGVLCVKEGQNDENDIMHNNGGSAEYERFLSLLGDEITLKGWDKFAGGLDVVRDLTGRTSRYVAQGATEVMFHVATMMPRDDDDEQALDIKRHIGNDVVTVAYLDGAAAFDPMWLHTHFTHVICLVKPHNVDTYAVQWAFKSPLHPCFSSALVPASELRSYLFNHLIWAEHFAYSAPVFAQKFERTRSAVLQLVRTWQDEDDK